MNSRSSSGSLSSPAKTMSDDDERQPDGRGREPSGGRLAELAPEHHEDEEAGEGQRRDQPDEVEHQPLINEMSSAVAEGCRRMMATMMPRPTTTSAAATTSTKNTTVCPRDVVERRGERHEREVHGVEHQLDAHEHHQRVAPHEHADHPDREQQRPEDEVPGRGVGVTARPPRRTRGAPRRAEHHRAHHRDHEQRRGELEGEHVVGEQGSSER